MICGLEKNCLSRAGIIHFPMAGHLKQLYQSPVLCPSLHFRVTRPDKSTPSHLILNSQTPLSQMPDI